MAMLECIDCGKLLSSTAATCISCGSTDPFGAKRSRDRRQLIGMILLIVFVLGVTYCFKTGLLTPSDVRNFLFHRTS